VTGLSDYKTNNNGSERNGESEGEDGNGRGDRQVVFRNLEVEGHIVEERPNN
jgi:hypothetical protein